MIERLEARDFVRFARLEADLAAGLTVVSGGSGAGKTVFLQALRFVLGQEPGGRAQATQCVRAGADEAEVSAWLQPPPQAASDLAVLLQTELGCDPPHRWLLRRTLSRGGRSRCFLGERAIPRALLRAIGARVVSFFGQGEAAQLRDPEHQRQILDAHAGILPKVDRYARRRAAAIELAAELAEVEDRLEAAAAPDPAREAERDALRALGPEPHEFEELVARAEQLAERLEQVHAVARLLAQLDDLELETGLDAVERARCGLDDTPRLQAAGEALGAARDLLGEASAAIEAELHAREATVDEAREELAATEARRDAYRALARRLRLAPGALAARWSELDAACPEELEARRRQLRVTLDEERAALDRLAKQLTAARRRSARALSGSLPRELAALGLAGATAAIEVDPLGDGTGALSEAHPAPWGRDRIAIHVGPNGGEPGALNQLSGGELARVFLLLGRYASGTDRTLVFDEVDQNVGARLGAAVGQAMVDLAADRQVLAVTHLAPVAARAHLHLRVEKRRGQSRLAALTRRAERVQELALMINGEPTRAALAQARELLRGAVVNAA